MDFAIQIDDLSMPK